MVGELPQTPLPVVGKTSLPPILEAEVPLSLILADLAIDLSIGWFLLVRIFFNQGRPELRVRVWEVVSKPCPCVFRGCSYLQERDQPSTTPPSEVASLERPECDDVRG